MVVVESGWVEGWIVSERHAARQRELEVWYRTNGISLNMDYHCYLEWSLLKAAGLKDGL